jgi:5-methylcytosine-specific restriction enzyme A
VARSLYGSRWQRARLGYLAEHPLCVMCQEQGRVTAATVVDHIIPHRGDMELFWDSDNWQSLCKPHHDSTKRRIEHSGSEIGCDVSGMPVDPGHHWRR